MMEKNDISYVLRQTHAMETWMKPAKSGTDMVTMLHGAYEPEIMSSRPIVFRSYRDFKHRKKDLVGDVQSVSPTLPS
jgi:hypothetical protein